MSDTVISVENLSKRYIIGHQRQKGDGLRHAIENAVCHPFRLLRSALPANGSALPAPCSGLPAPCSPLREEFWALKDVSFEVKQGEVIGIIGRNGAGKSTLLKILSRITEPTHGCVRLKGRVASLLEVGTGFHPELTGRENIFLNGAILGMTKAEIKRKFDEIVAFSGVEKFLDTPVKRYSSGMYVRLAFAVAAHLEPEILIVDEVLAVGDAEFQKKCLGKMRDVATGGRTVLFVSHNIAAVESLCSRAILLGNGRLGCIGSTAAVIRHYKSTLASQANVALADRSDRKGAGHIRVTDIETLDEEGHRIPYLTSGQTTIFRVHYACTASRVLEDCRVILTVRKDDRPYIMLPTDVVVNHRLDLTGSGCLDYTVPDLPLSAGEYGLDFYIEAGGVMQDGLAYAFSVSAIDGNFYGTGRSYPDGWGGQYVLVRFSWKHVKRDRPEPAQV